MRFGTVVLFRCLELKEVDYLYQILNISSFGKLSSLNILSNPLKCSCFTNFFQQTSLCIILARPRSLCTVVKQHVSERRQFFCTLCNLIMSCRAINYQYIFFLPVRLIKRTMFTLLLKYHMVMMMHLKNKSFFSVMILYQTHAECLVVRNRSKGILEDYTKCSKTIA